MDTIVKNVSASADMDTTKEIRIQGARVNTLKNISCNLPHEKITVITGPSGSGKSSLAFDTLYAEGQRRYIESMSSYARQFLARIEKPDVDNIRHILPAIALEQKNSVKNARSTVGTATEIYDYLRMLYAHVGQTRCDVCGGEVSRTDPLRIHQELQRYPEGSKVLLLASVSLRDIGITELIAQGFFRMYRQGGIVDLSEVRDTLSLHDTIRIVVDRLIVKPKTPSARVLESIRSGLKLGNGHMEMVIPSPDGPEGEDDVHGFQNVFGCLHCHKVFTEPSPAFFSFNSPLGACPACEGFGRITGLDMDKVIPDKTRSLAEGAIHPFSGAGAADEAERMFAECRKRKIPLDKPWNQLTDKQKSLVVDGGGDFEGIRGFFTWLESRKYKVHVRIMIARYRGYYPCPECHGSRLRSDALNVRVSDKNILEIGDMPIGNLFAFFETLTLPGSHARVAERLLSEIRSRLRTLQNIGLSYLTLNRNMRTLSNGEAQRINLSAALGGALTDTLYVLDEPTVGLHARDTDRLIGILRGLRDQGNTVVLVEHDPDVMLAADHIVDMGPGGGDEGGRIIFEGAPADLRKVSFSLTAQYLNRTDLTFSTADEVQENINEPTKATKAGKAFEADVIEIRDACGNNLKNLTVAFPKGKIVCITGVSGSGKSTLIRQTLFAAYEHSQARSVTLEEAPHRGISGLDSFQDVLLVDQSPPGRSVRSNPITYVKAYDDIRKLFAETRQATVLGITAGHFSFNTTGGRCETCQGLGTLTIDMQFMADVTVVCPDCQGKRFNPNVLSVEVSGKNINDILNLTVDEAMTFFASQRRIATKLSPLREIGLGYLKLGQSTSTLSGGEAQRLKLAAYLPGENLVQAKEPFLFLFDEPTTGLHMADIALLVQAFRRLLAVGHSIIVIEHNIDFIAQTDYIIDLGPEGGEEGGNIVAQGTVSDIVKVPASHTGRFLSQRLVTATTSVY